MWAAIRSDLQEFALGVADETDQVIATTATTPGKGPPPPYDDGDVVEGGYTSTGVVSCPQDEIERRQEDAETYTTALDEGDEEVQAFLDSFSIDDKTQEIAELLKDNPDTIQVHFERLVPTELSYALFWQRYFYRCGDEDRIARQWQEEREARRQARADAISGGIASVTNLFGGALSAVSQTLEKADSAEVPTSPFIGAGGKNKGGGGMSIFGSGRPPFVMNTAVDEDDDEEEEELGWDDDDDEEEEYENDEEEREEDEEEDDNQMDVSEEITFSGGRNNEAVEKISEQLMQALSERDACKETIELQNKEITKLKEGQPESDKDRQMERLKLKLFEKDAEIAAMKATFEDTHEDDEDGTKGASKQDAQLESLKSDVARLTDVVAETESKLADQTEAAKEAQEELERIRETSLSGQQVLQSSLDATLAEAASLRAALEGNSAKSEEFDESQEQINAGLFKIGTLEAELKEKTEKLEAAKKEAVEMEQGMVALQEKLMQLQGDLAQATEYVEEQVASATAAAEAQVAAATAAVEEAKKEAVVAMEKSAAATTAMEDAMTEAAVAKEEAVAAKAEAEAAVVISAGAVHPDAVVAVDRSSPSSVSTGVKIEQPIPTSPALAAAAPGDNDEEADEWGDDWSDDDE